MNIVEKLTLQKQLGGLVLFREGIFLRCYNESAYILTQLLRQNLKVKYYYVKQHKIWVIMSGFPLVNVSERLPKATSTDFGAVLADSFNLHGYQAWFNAVASQANNESEVSIARKTDAPASVTRATQGKLFIQNSNEVILPLNQSQISYLVNWQQNQHSLEAEKNFIKSLKESLLFL